MTVVANFATPQLGEETVTAERVTEKNNDNHNLAATASSGHRSDVDGAMATRD